MTQHERFCQACGMPMSAPDAQGASDKYCAYCSDSDGNLKS
ncbi:zinc ribbon domain-containing protein, partial [Klebsiella pneumoniae]